MFDVFYGKGGRSQQWWDRTKESLKKFMLYIAYLKHLKPEKHKLYLISKVYHRISNVHCNQILLRKKVEVYDKG